MCRPNKKALVDAENAALQGNNQLTGTALVDAAASTASTVACPVVSDVVAVKKWELPAVTAWDAASNTSFYGACPSSGSVPFMGRAFSLRPASPLAPVSCCAVPLLGPRLWA